MNTWTAATTLAPEIELLVRRWQLPEARIPDVQQLLDTRNEGGTATTLDPSTPTRTEAWGSACLSVSDGEITAKPARPLVLRRHKGQYHLQPWRFFHAEQTIARLLIARASETAPQLARTTADLLSGLGDNEVNEQQGKAIACALQHTLTLITGGPGTGKTHTIARLLALLIAGHPSRPLVAHLAAPTGKAADRMKEAVEAAADRLPRSIAEQTKLALKQAAASASTLHRLLGFNPSTGQCRYGANNPLRSDLVIIDECSMVDTLLWQALLSALPPGARLVLVGDPHQLESVAAGDVLGSLVRFAQRTPGEGIGRFWIELTESHRFRNRTGIGRLASAVVNLRADEAIALLADHMTPSSGTAPADGLSWLGTHDGRFAWEYLPAVVRSEIESVADAETPKAALAALSRVRILSAHREHTLGVAGVNAAVQRHLQSRPDGRRAPNRPIIINHNDPETGLTNGSVGIVMDTGGVSAAYFPATSAAGEPHRIALSQLPDHSPAWALTIHRSQGSEFDHVVVILPNEESPLATRELLYTAITRAKECVHVLGSETAVRAALGEKALRCTLLEASLATSSTR